MFNILLVSSPLTSSAKYNRYVTFSIQYRHGDTDCQTEQLLCSNRLHSLLFLTIQNIRPCHQRSRSLDICRHSEFITFWLSRTASWMYATCAMILEEPWEMRSPQNLDDLQMHL